MTALLQLVLLIAGLAILVAGAGWLVTGASSLARRLGVSEIVIGLTVVAFGTSAPELVVNMISAVTGRNEIVFGNIVGSNIFNILLILGVAGLIRPLAVQRNTVWREIPFSLLAALVLLAMVNDRVLDAASADGLGRGEGLVLLGFFATFLTYTFAIAKVQSPDSFPVRVRPFWQTAGLVAGGLAALMAGGSLAVDGAVGVARAAGLSEKTIALTIVAGGTSLPELATSAVAARRAQCDIAVGNIVGSNIFNVFFILGAGAVVRPAVFNPAVNADILVLLAATAALFLTMFTGRARRLDRWEAGMFLLSYVVYAGFVVVRN